MPDPRHRPQRRANRLDRELRALSPARQRCRNAGLRRRPAQHLRRLSRPLRRRRARFLTAEVWAGGLSAGSSRCLAAPRHALESIGTGVTDRQATRLNPQQHVKEAELLLDH